jgi:hypothetical protein
MLHTEIRRPHMLHPMPELGTSRTRT